MKAYKSLILLAGVTAASAMISGCGMNSDKQAYFGKEKINGKPVEVRFTNKIWSDDQHDIYVGQDSKRDRNFIVYHDHDNCDFNIESFTVYDGRDTTTVDIKESPDLIDEAQAEVDCLTDKLIDIKNSRADAQFKERERKAKEGLATYRTCK